MRTIIAIVLLLILTTVSSAAQISAPLDLQAAINAAQPWTVLTVPPGVYYGAITVDKPLHLVGWTDASGGRAIIDGEGRGTVLTITASNVLVENFVIRNSGNVIDKEEGGIVVDGAEDVLLVGNHLENVLYGIRGIQAHRLVIRDNYITGKELDIARRGDGIRLWESENCVVEGNTLERVRDAIFWFSDGTRVRNNVFQFNRYGIHMMYTDGMTVEGNFMNANSVGAYLMYSTNVQLIGNTFQENRGPSGYGLALKDMNAVTVRDNYMIDNRAGLFFDNSPSNVDIEQQIERNAFAYNDIGVLMMPAVKRNLLRHNTFLDNLDQVGVKGGGSQAGEQLGGNTWNGNFWSDYVGYDGGEETEDGIGDLPYRAESLFENIADRYPELKIFHFSPVESAIDMAARAFPVIKPKPKLTDETPLMTPMLPTVPPLVQPVQSRMGWLAAGLLIGALALLGSRLQAVIPWQSAATGIKPHAQPPITQQQQPVAEPSLPFTQADKDQPMLTVKNLTKRYPRPGRAWWSDATVTAADTISFRLHKGEALALWGVNGAGKTTVLKCLLGLLDCEGDLHLDGLDLRRDGRRARRLLGYVPQELAFHADMTVAESCHFYARLKDMPSARIPVVLAQVGLTEQMQKAVGALSGGMKQRLALALALLADPPLLLLDEPTSNLDAATRNEFIDLLVTLRRQGKSLLFTSHHVEEVERLADQVLILRDGQVSAQGTPVTLIGQLAPERQKVMRHIKVITASEEQARAQEILTAAGYNTSPNGRGLWVEVLPERKAAPLSVLYTADVDVLDVEL